MSNLQKVAFGVASDGSQGDTTRAGFTKDNANVDVLNAQATLTSFGTTLTTSQTLTAALHLGKRVNINFASPAAIGLPTASSCGADGVILLRNTGTTLVTIVSTGSDTTSLTTLAAGESALMDSNGVSAWTCLTRGRSSSANEVVQGNCSVLGSETITGTLASGAHTVTGALSVSGVSTLTGGAAFGAAPTYSTAAVARSAFQNAAVGKAIVVGSIARVDFSTATFPVTWNELTDTANAFDGIHFLAPVTGSYRIAVTLGIGSAPTAGSYVDVSLNDGVSGSIIKRNRNVAPAAGSIFTVGLTHIFSCNAGQSVYVALQGSVAMFTVADGSFSGLYIDQIA